MAIRILRGSSWMAGYPARRGVFFQLRRVGRDFLTTQESAMNSETARPPRHATHPTGRASGQARPGRPRAGAMGAGASGRGS